MRTQIQLVGHLGSDPESRDVGNGTVCSFSMAVNRKVKGDEQTDWFSINAWGKLGELCQQYLGRGRQAIVAGTLEPRTYEKDGVTRTALDVRANEVHFLGEGKGTGGRESSSSPSSVPASAPDPQDSQAKPDDEIPF